MSLHFPFPSPCIILARYSEAMCVFSSLRGVYPDTPLTELPQIPQLYVNFPASAGEPPSVLRGFTNVEVAPYEREKVTITLSRYDLSIWDTEAQGWRRPKGTIHISVGVSSRDIRLGGKIPAE